MRDIQNLTLDELNRLPECINAMANSSGGLIQLEGGREIRVPQAEKRPVFLNGRVWRRIEGQNVISNLWAISVMARDYDDDDPADDACLDEDSLAEFREEVLKRNEYFRQFSHKEFLRRTGIFSGKHITFAGALMFGEELRIRAVLNHHEIHAEIERHNIWRAIRDILPRLTLKLSPKSSSDLRDAFVWAIFNSDYSLAKNIDITIASEPPRVIIDSPGIITGSVRNHRLSRIFSLLGLTPSPFYAEQDMLNFRAVSTIFIEGISPVIL